MRIVIDMQGAQTESRFRGIGRYTMSFAKAVVRNRGGHEVILALSGLFPDTIEPIRAEFDGLLPQENIRVWHAPGPVRECQPGNDSRREVAELLREAFLASLKPDLIHICSLFEGYVDDAVTSIGRFDTQTPVSVTLYDLIPLLNPDHYLKPNPRYEQYYLRKIGFLKRAALFLAISDYSRQEAVGALGIAEERAINISSAIDAHFQPQAIPEATARALQQKFGIQRPFVLCTGAADERKNLPRLIEAYAALPQGLRKCYQLVLAGKMPDGDIVRLRQLASKAGLKEGELLFTGYITDDELVQLYNLCALFVFPSWHEGFGLPALEAMACGAAVIGANTSSLPEVIGFDEALFDPFDVSAMAAKMAQVLENKSFCEELKRYGLEQAKRFSWDRSAKGAVSIWEMYISKVKPSNSVVLSGSSLPRLAYISPLSPERSGISDYSAELLPELSRYYNIDVIVAQNDVTDNWIKKKLTIRDVQWLRSHSSDYDRVLYHIGNSPFHIHMFDLLEELPGVIVLHDFFLSSVIAYMEWQNIKPRHWAQILYHSHGYKAVEERFHAKDTDAVKWKYPCNLHVLQNAKGVIVHSEYSRVLAKKWYGDSAGKSWTVIPLLRTLAAQSDRSAARKELNISSDDFVICSFGALNPTKLNHRLLKAWLSSKLAKDKRCRLIFVGQNHGGDYGRQLDAAIQSSGIGPRIRITGWVDAPAFRTYLACADLAVQLRTLSRGETSAAVLDCMNYGLPTIVNANGSMAELPQDAVYMFSDEFEDAELVRALETLWNDEGLRRSLGDKAKDIIRTRHNPSQCAKWYFEAIEDFYARPQTDSHNLVESIAKIDGHTPTLDESVALANSIAQSIPAQPKIRQLLLDVTATARTDLKTGIERVTRALISALLQASPQGCRIEPVYLSNEGGFWHYKYARKYTLGLFECPQDVLSDDIADLQPGDIILGLDISGNTLVEAGCSGLFTHFREYGVNVYFMVYDLLPVTHHDFFPPGAELHFEAWLQAVASLDGAICISQATAESLIEWLKGGHCPYRRRPFRIAWDHLGADLASSVPSRGLPANASKIIEKLYNRPSCLMVGTIEPRKGYLQTLAAFDTLWKEGVDVNLVIVGKEGWKHLPDEQRRDIPETVRCLRAHPELGKRLFWLEGISDEYLEKVYASCTCLIAASYGEGFGLPLIEAAQHKLPIIARDIPVFREVAGEHAFYFLDDNSPETLATAIKEWLSLYREGRHPKSDNMPYLTWKQSAQNLLDILLHDKWAYKILPDGTLKPGIVQNHRSARLVWKKGWSGPEKDFRWTNGKDAVLEFEISSKDVPRCGAIRLRFNSLGKQSVTIEFNGGNLFDGIVEGVDQELILPAQNFCEGQNRLVLQLPDARQPANGDKRFLAIALKEFEIMEKSE
ncbi:MAG: glycosyltransferase [Dissulfuribacterales bacterium]